MLRKRGWLEASGLALIVTGVLAFYAYIGCYEGDPYRFTKQSGNYYLLLVDGLMAGRAGFKVDPPPQLIALKDPYDPVQRQQAGNLGMHDVTYYKGRYYLYFGVAPALTLFLPFSLLTGWQFPQNLATVVFCAGGYLCSLGLFLSLRRIFFPQCRTGVVWLGALMLGGGNFCAAMLSRSGVWEVPISSGYFFSCLGFWLLFLGWRGEPRRRPLWWLASVAFGLAVASRPHFVFCPALLGGWWIWQNRGRIRSARFWHEATGLFLPLALIVVGLLTYNYLRFDNAFEFGQKYQLSGNSQLNVKLVSTKFFPINFYLNFLAPAQFERYFPFFQVIRGYPGVRPESYGGAEDPYGVLPNMPFSWLALVAPLVWFVCFRQRRELGGWLSVFGLSFLSIVLPTLCFAWAANRYMVDFIPSLLLASAMGLLMVSGLEWSSRIARISLRAILIGVVGYTVVFNLGVAFQHNGMFKAHRPAAFETLSRWFNRPTMWWEARRGEAYGPVELTLRLPNDRLGHAEPIMVTGVSYRSDYLYLYYFPDGQRAQLGYTRTNHSHHLSQPFRIDFRVPHRIGIRAGSLYPAKTHPYFSGWSPESVQVAKETLSVTVDGIPYLNAHEEFFDSSPGFITFGENHVSDYIERKFTGELLAVRRQPTEPAIEPFGGAGFLRLGVVLPEVAAGRAESIVETGEAGKSDALSVQYIDKTHVRFGFHHSGQETLFSPPMDVTPGEVQVIDASLGSFYPHPTNARERELAGMLVLRLNGLPVWSEPRAFYPNGSQAPVIGRNFEIDRLTSAAFSGRVVAQHRVMLFPSAPESPFSVGGYWLEAANKPTYGAIRLHVELPKAKIAKPEPLLVTGPMAAQADYVIITAPVPGQFSVGYIHVGTTGFQSQRVKVDATRPQLFEIDVPSLYPSESDDFFANYSLREIAAIKKGQARIKLNDEVLWEAKVPFYGATAEQATIGEDKISQVFAPKFTGRILAAERFCTTPPPGLSSGVGPLEIELTFPSAGVGKETLLVTGEESKLDRLFLVYDTPQQAHLRFENARGEPVIGSSFAAVPGARHKFSISWGGLYPESIKPEKISGEEWRGFQRKIQVSIDGNPVLSGASDFVQGSPQMLRIGQAASDGASFSGTLNAVRRAP